MTAPELLARLETLEAEIAQLRAQAAGMAPEGQTLRRDVLRYGAVALGMAAAAGLIARPVEAADGDPVRIGVSNLGTQPTIVEKTTVDGVALVGRASATTGLGDGLYGHSEAFTGIGVAGLAASGSPGASAGVAGRAYSAIGSGVLGVGDAPFGNNAGVRGVSHSSSGTGVVGTVTVGGVGARGEIPASVTANAIAVYGLNNSSYEGSGPGGGGFGIYGHSNKGHGLVGATGTAGGAAIAGSTNSVAWAYAGVFYGPVVVTGALIVVGSKSAAVPHPDGSHRLVYCVESPESWLEDFGQGTLSCGRTEIVIDPGFTAVADLSDYHVFLTERGSHHHLMVRERTASGFVVEADRDLAALKALRTIT